MFRFSSAALLAVIAALSFFSNPTSAKGPEWVYVVSEGDNLWNISKKYLTNVTYFEDVRKFNNISYPKQMQPGSLVRIPLEWVIKQSATVKVKSLNGESSLYRNESLMPVSLNSEFNLGDELRVGNTATITLIFADKTEMTLTDGVIVAFDHLTKYGKTGMVDTRVRLSNGKMEIRAEKQKGIGSRLDIATASAITSVRGTVFRVGVDRNNRSGSLVEVIEGEVAVSQGEKTVAVKQGFGVKVEKGKDLSAPIRLLEAPELVEFEKLMQTENSSIRWLPVNDAKSYNVFIAKDAMFSDIVWKQRIAKTNIQVPTLNDGIYYLRLSAVSREGLEGVPQDSMFELNAYPKPPSINSTSVIHVNGTQQLSWKKVNDHNLPVLLQLSKYADFSELVSSETLRTDSFRPSKDLQTGQYFWRLATLEQDDSLTHGPFSETNQFRYSLLLPAPKLKASLKQGNVFLSWKPRQDNEYVELQISSNDSFKQVRTETIQGRNKTELDVPADDVSYIRARSRLKGEPEPGKWSKPCKVSVHSNLVICGA